MAKNFFQDMVKVNHARRREETGQKFIQKEAEVVSTKGPRYSLWFVAVMSLAFFLFSLSYIFGRATVTVNPKIQDMVLNEDLSASKGAGAEALPFDLVVISGEENKVIQTAAKKEISQKAEGVAVIYNTFSSSSQPLSIDTRLEGSNGKMYKTETKTTVPGKSAEGKPGSVEVKIYGVDAGQEYNSIPLDFKIFGFKGTPKYSKFYGRSKGEITGGLKGKFPFVTEAEKATAASELKATLLANLIKKASEQIPAGFILFKDAVYLDTDEGNIDFVGSKDNILPMTLKGTLYGILFDVQKLSKKIASDNVEKYDGSDIFIPNIQELTFSLSNKDNISFNDIKNIKFNLSDPVKIVWKLGAEKLIAALLGKSKSDFNQILLQYPSIQSAELVATPIWSMSIPDKAKDIKVIVNYPK